MNGIDVSSYQKTIDWNKVKADGIDYAFVRVAFRGYGDAGTLNTDGKFAENLKNAPAAGVKTGAYIYSQAITVKEAVEEANFILKHIKGYDVTLPVVIDYEYAATGVGRLYNAKLSKRHDRYLRGVLRNRPCGGLYSDDLRQPEYAGKADVRLRTGAEV